MAFKRIDRNQNEIVNGLRQIKCSVFITSSLGSGFPDLVVGHRGINYLFEIKDSDKPKSKRKLTKAEQHFFDRWRGKVDVITCFDDALKIIQISNITHPES